MQTTRLTAGAVLLALLFGTQADVSHAATPIQRSKNDAFLAKTLAQKSPRGWSSVIVQWNGARTPARMHRLRALGAASDRPLPLIHADALRVPLAKLARLAALPFVKHLSADLTCRKSDEYTVGATGADVAFAQAGLTGSSVNVAVLDSGIQSERADIQNRTVAGVNFSGDADTIDDLCGHGTHVAGIIAGDGTASTGPAFFRTFYGIARQAGLVNVRVLDNTGQGTVSAVIQRSGLDGGAQIGLQYPCLEPVAGPPGRRKLHDRSALPGRRSRLEIGHRRLRGGQSRAAAKQYDPDRRLCSRQ